MEKNSHTKAILPQKEDSLDNKDEGKENSQMVKEKERKKTNKKKYDTCISVQIFYLKSQTKDIYKEIQSSPMDRGKKERNQTKKYKRSPKEVIYEMVTLIAP